MGSTIYERKKVAHAVAGHHGPCIPGGRRPPLQGKLIGQKPTLPAEGSGLMGVNET